MPIDSREVGMSSGSCSGGKVDSCSWSHGARNIAFPRVVWTVRMYFLRRSMKSWSGLELGGVSMIPRYRISLYTGTSMVTAFGFLRDFALGFAAGLKSSWSDGLSVVVVLLGDLWFCSDGGVVSVGRVSR